MKKIFSDTAKKEMQTLDRQFANLVPPDFIPPAHRGAQVASLTCQAIRHEFERVIEGIQNKLTDLEMMVEERKKHAEAVIAALRETGEKQAASLEAVFAEMEAFTRALNNSGYEPAELPALPKQVLEGNGSEPSVAN